MSGLERRLGLGGAIITGLGSILGTGVFVSIAVAAGFAGRWTLLALPLAGLVALFNGLASARLAAAHPVAGGTYEHGYRYLGPWRGFLAGWLFLVAKTASAATAALGLAGYGLGLAGADPRLQVPVAVASALAVTALVASGIRRTAAVNLALVLTTVAALGVFVAVGAAQSPAPATRLASMAGPWWEALASATAFLFVAYTGYGRIATLGEEVREPGRTIPRAVMATLAISAVLYGAVGLTGWRIAGASWSSLAGSRAPGAGAPLAGLLENSAAARVVELGAVVAMAGVLLNLVLGLSRVWLAMGRRRDMPGLLARVSGAASPIPAVVVAGLPVAGLALVGDVRTTWSFSAMTVLLYYALTNWAALRLPPGRRSPRWVAAMGLASCAFLSVWVEPSVWLGGVAVMGAGVTWRLAFRTLAGRRARGTGSAQ